MAKKMITRALNLIDDLMGDMSKKDKEQLGKAIGLLVGAVANEKYQSSSELEKRAWEENRIMHHGDFGAIVEDYGQGKKNPLLKGLGSGLKISDKHDEHLWVYSPLIVQKPKPKGKKRVGRR